ncbi:hypothetical protein [Futiania mangrovi]|uniref:Uncharacterized protein n=1 Tax=Futiania mangrovi TaxID=2959716 RepID=A0A9J6PH68_9PROT|nr:hypothetical protein [Futiania mangrovii]MCP1337155.1 hypothetical protein [Futiania mangrovii]
MQKVDLQLDANGCGEALYRLSCDGKDFHYFVISQDLPESQKLDRNFAASWDIMAVLCEGSWTPDREEYLRRQVPLQRAGRGDIDTLIYARGNRSGRLFNAVVDALAAGRQPDLRELARVGYIVRTTAFIGNGQLGTRPFSGYGADHPFGAPYHAQIMAGFLLREFSFDLVNEMAAARSAGAVQLAPEICRFLGLGNAAATGLVPFLVNHPRLVGEWVASDRAALADICAQPVTPAIVERTRALVGKAAAFLAETDRPDDGVFATDATLAAGLGVARSRLDEGGDRTLTLGELRERMADGLHPGVRALLDSIFLDVLPGVADRHARIRSIDERLAPDWRGTTGSLLSVVRDRYGWALAAADREGSGAAFWYRASGAPRDLRRGLIGRRPEAEFETAMDVVPRIQALHAALEKAQDKPLADFLADHPELRHIAARVHGLADLPFAELEVDLTAMALSPFPPVRLVLALFGLDQFEAAHPKSVRGTFLQGAPIELDLRQRVADEDDQGHRWPFPLMPQKLSAGARPVIARDAIRFDAEGKWRCPYGEDAEGRETLIITPIELERGFLGLMQSGGLDLGVAEEAAVLATEAVIWQPRLAGVLVDELSAADANLGEPLRLVQSEPNRPALLSGGCAALAAAPAVLDLACARAITGAGSGLAIAHVGVAGLAAGPALAAAAARRGFIALVATCDGSTCSLTLAEDRGTSVALTEPTPISGPDAALLFNGRFDLETIKGALRNQGRARVPAGLFLACVTSGEIADALRDAMPHEPADADVLLMSANRDGVAISRDVFLALERLSARLYVSPDVEVDLRDEIIDPLKMF